MEDGELALSLKVGMQRMRGEFHSIFPFEKGGTDSTTAQNRIVSTFCLLSSLLLFQQYGKMRVLAHSCAVSEISIPRHETVWLGMPMYEVA